MKWKARLFYNWQLCLPADGCNFLNVPSTESKIFEFAVKTERTNIYWNYNICALDIVSQPFNLPWLGNTEALWFSCQLRKFVYQHWDTFQVLRNIKLGHTEPALFLVNFLVNLCISSFKKFESIWYSPQSIVTALKFK